MIHDTPCLFAKNKCAKLLMEEMALEKPRFGKYKFVFYVSPRNGAKGTKRLVSKR